MPRLVSSEEKGRALYLMTLQNDEGGFALGQRDIERETGLSRPYLRKLAKEIGHQFPRNGIEVQGTLCMCSNCGFLFRKPPSRVKRSKNQFCSKDCKDAYMTGINHPSWRTGKSSKSFSEWVKNQKEYKTWRISVLERDGYKCAISGKTEELEAHHILPKSESFNPEKAFDVSNGLTVNKQVHDRIHALVRSGYGFEEAIERVKQEYKND